MRQSAPGDVKKFALFDSFTLFARFSNSFRSSNKF